MIRVKGLTLWQPWASLIALGKKRIETRSWPTGYRGDVVIQASSISPSEARACTFREAFRRALQGAPHPLPRAAALCVVRIADVVDTSQFWRVDHGPKPHAGLIDLSPEEYAFGDFTPGRCAWLLEDLRVFPEPIPMKGAMGLFDVTNPEVLAAVEALAQHREVLPPHA